MLLQIRYLSNNIYVYIICTFYGVFVCVLLVLIYQLFINLMCGYVTYVFG